MEPTIFCPVCRRWGSAKLGGYCRTHHKSINEDEKHVLDDFHEVANINKEFFSQDDFGYMTDKFGYER